MLETERERKPFSPDPRSPVVSQDRAHISRYTRFRVLAGYGSLRSPNPAKAPAALNLQNSILSASWICRWLSASCLVTWPALELMGSENGVMSPGAPSNAEVLR